MQVHRDDGVANHIGPEPCAGIREDVGEASVGVRAGQPLSRERKLFLGADAVCVAEGKTFECAIASARAAQRGREPGMHARSLSGNREICGLALHHRKVVKGPHREGEEPKPMMNDAQKSDCCRSSDEVGEQARRSGCGVDGAKAAGQGERGRVLHAPDTEPGARVPGT